MAKYRSKYKSKYGRRRKRKPAPYVSKQWASSKKGAKSQASQIMSLQRQMNAVKLSVRNNIQWSQYQYKPPVMVHSGDLLAPKPFTVHLVGPSQELPHSGWRRIFNSDAQVENNLKWEGRSMGIEYQASLGNAATASAPITCTIFCVSLRPKIQTLVNHETNYLGTLTEGEHYVQNNMGSVQGSGMVFLNKSMFKIHYVDRFTIGAKTNFVTVAGEEAPTTTIGDNLHRRYFTLPYKELLKGDGAGGTGTTWSSLTYKTVPQKSQRYLLVFPNNYGDQTFDLTINCLFTGRTTQ